MPDAAYAYFSRLKLTTDDRRFAGAGRLVLGQEIDS
jgi:hypothetical protein